MASSAIGSARAWRNAWVVVLCSLSSVPVFAQADFARNYVRAEIAFQNGDLAEAERLFLASLKSPDVPKSRGARVLLVSQQYGFFPELYLTLIYRQQGRYAEVQTYAAQAKKYIKGGDPLYLELLNAESEAKRALARQSTVKPDDSRSVRLTKDSAGSSEVGAGRMYALVIGIDRYTDRTFPSLKTAVNDATEIGTLLRDRYGFDTKLLKDATRYQIIEALDGYRRTVDESSSLLIYYAGHGTYDAAPDKAFWLPSDADNAITANWISADDITRVINAIPAKHVIVISDSCYSGGLTREAITDFAPIEHEAYVKKAAQSKSRNLLSSGANEPVLDGGGKNNHSVFATALLNGLEHIEFTDFTAHELFQDYVSVSVSGQSQQLPQYVPIRNSGHDQGDFVFHRKKTF